VYRGAVMELTEKVRVAIGGVVVAGGGSLLVGGAS
jgi:hypothetical protein